MRVDEGKVGLLFGLPLMHCVPIKSSPGATREGKSEQNIIFSSRRNVIEFCVKSEKFSILPQSQVATRFDKDFLLAR